MAGSSLESAISLGSPESPVGLSAIHQPIRARAAKC